MNAAIVADRWDREDLATAVDRIDPFADAREELTKRLTWGGQALDDVFLLLHKVRPVVVPVDDTDDDVAGQVLVWLLSESPAVQRLRHHTVRDLTRAALVAAALAPQLDELARSLENLKPEADQVLSEQLSSGTHDAADEFEASAAVLAEQEEEQDRAAPAWGVTPGLLRQLSVEERLELSRRLNTSRAREITDLFGRLRTSLFADQTELAEFGTEPVDVTLGGSVEHMVGAELLSMLSNELFFAKVGDGSLLQYDLRADTPVGRGGIVLCVDGSGSMGIPHQGYTRELWATAFKLHLLHLAVRENRPMHVIDFGAASEQRYQRFVDPDERTPLRLLDGTTAWFGYGTDFAAPLRRAVQVLADEGDRSSDVVFVSDGECDLSPRARTIYQRAARARGIRTWGVQVGRTPGGLRQFCDEIFTISDLTSGRELGAILNAVGRPR